MTTGEVIRIGARGSALSLKQVDIVVQALVAANPNFLIEIKTIVPRGDRDKTTPIPLDQIGKGWFSQEIEEELIGGRIDLAVHSLKDLQEESATGLMIGAYLPREDARDVLITKRGESLEELKQGAVIGTDSARRAMQMKALRPDIIIKSLRGNVPNRVEKLQTDGYDAIILAAAGLKRLGMEKRITRYFEPREMTPAPGQGIIAVETRIGDTQMLEQLKTINDGGATHAARLERSFSKIMGGGCKAPTGAYAWWQDDAIHLLGAVARDDGTVLREELSATLKESQGLGDVLAQKILTRRNADA